MRCPHEVIVSALDPPQVSTPSCHPEADMTGAPSTSHADPATGALPKLAVCNACKSSFDFKSGGRCMDCKNKILYCSKKCQVFHTLHSYFVKGFVKEIYCFHET